MSPDVPRSNPSFEDQKRFCFERLCLAWGGDSWLPSDVFACDSSPSAAAMQCMDKATVIAQSRLTELPFLWDHNGPLRIAFESSGQNLSSDFCTIVHQMVDDWERQYEKACSRKMNALLVVVTSQFQLGELNGLFLSETEGATLDPNQTALTPNQRGVLEAEIRKATQEAQTAETDINARQSELRAMLKTVEGLGKALKGA
ncbi:unnamed protein product [Clonostachys rosea]|uniref:Uncharacterized protein n=1 Tax=Bionectria ochroleuca TaxID=29856 RepID=A0ABY6U6N5_BIOOC|nr:unnamed protein product [Clonostachys rosea]